MPAGAGPEEFLGGGVGREEQLNRLRADLARIDVPTLVIQGDADKNNPLELTGRRAAELIPDAKLVILGGAGHGLYRSEAERYTGEIVAFARALPARLPSR